MDCVVDCPRPNVITAGRGKWEVSHPVYAALVVGSIVLLTGAAQLAGKWETKPPELRLTDKAGKLDPENIRGWMTLEEVSKGFSVPLERLYAETGLARSVPSNVRLNTISRQYKVEFEPEKMRTVVQNHLAGKLLASAAVSITPVIRDGAAPRPAVADSGGTGRTENEMEVKGMMTLNEIAWKTGVPKAYVIRELRLPADTIATQPVREWMHEQGKSIQDVRDCVLKYRSGKH